MSGLFKKTFQDRDLPDFAVLSTRIYIAAKCVLAAVLFLVLAFLLAPSMLKLAAAVAGLALITIVAATTVLLRSALTLRRGLVDLDQTMSMNIADLIPKQDRD